MPRYVLDAAREIGGKFVNGDPDVLDAYRDVTVKLKVPPSPWGLIVGATVIGAILYFTLGGS